MIWDSWSDFFAMGGYGLYVWGSVSVVLIFIAGELMELAWRGRAIRTEISFAKLANRPSRTPHETPT